MKRILQIAPTLEPVTLQEAKVHARIDIIDDDPLINALIVSARQYCEQYTGLAFIKQSWLASFDRDEVADEKRSIFSRKREISLQHGYINSVTRIRTYNQADAITVFDEKTYRISFDSIILLNGVFWPIDLRARDCIDIVYTVGFGGVASDVPQPIKQAILMLVAYWYDNRSAAAEKQNTIPFSVQSILNPFKNLFS